MLRRALSRLPMPWSKAVPAKIASKLSRTRKLAVDYRASGQKPALQYW